MGRRRCRARRDDDNESEGEHLDGTTSVGADEDTRDGFGAIEDSILINEMLDETEQIDEAEDSSKPPEGNHENSFSSSEEMPNSNSNSLDSLPKKRSRVSTRTEDFEYELPSGRRRRSARTNTVEPKIKYDTIDSESRYECPACPMKFDFDYGLLTHVESHPVLPCTCHLCDEFFGSVHGLVFHFLKCHQSVKQIKRRDCIGINSEKTRTLRSSAPAENQMAMAEFSPVKSPVFGMELVPFSCSRTPLRSRLIAEKNCFDSGFRCPNCGKLFPIYSGLGDHFQSCEKPVEKTKKGRKRRTRTSLNAAGNGLLTWKIKPSSSDLTCDSSANMDERESFFTALGLIRINRAKKHQMPQKELPLFVPENEPTFSGEASVFHLDTIDTVDCTGSGQFIEMNPGYDEKPIVRPIKPTRGTSFRRLGRGVPVTIQVKEEVKEEKKEEPVMPSPAKKVKKEPIQEGPHHCKLCADSFFSEADLNNHEKSKHVKIQTYQCKICNYCSLEKSLMIRHMRTHSGQRPFYCKECGYAFTTKANCERHIRKRHNKAEKSEIDDLIRCDQNQLKTVSEDSWKYEIATVCMHCDHKFPDFWSLRDHLKIHDKRSFYCSDCSAAFSCRSNCIAHIMQKHEVTDREEANEKVKYEPGGGAKTKRKKLSDDPPEDDHHTSEIETQKDQDTSGDVSQDTFTCKLCQKGFEAFIPFLNHFDDMHYKSFARDSIKIKDEINHDFEKLFSAAQRAKDVVHSKTKISALTRWDIRNYMLNRRATRMYKARMIPFKRLNEIRNKRRDEVESRVKVEPKFVDSKLPIQPTYSPRIQTIKRNPTLAEPNRPTHQKPSPVHQKLVNPDRSYINVGKDYSYGYKASPISIGIPNQSEHTKIKQNWIVKPKSSPNAPTPINPPSSVQQTHHTQNSQPQVPPKNTVLHVQRREKSSLPNQPIKVQVPKSFMIQTKPINKEKRLLLQNTSYPKQTVMLQTPNKQIPNTISVPSTVYHQKPLNQIFLKESAHKTFVIQRPKQSDTSSAAIGSKVVSSPAMQGQGTNQNLGQAGVPYESVSHYQKQPTRLTSANGNSYEIKGIPSSQSSYSSNGQRHHVFEVLNRKSIIQQNKSANYISPQHHQQQHHQHHQQQHSHPQQQLSSGHSEIHSNSHPIRTSGLTSQIQQHIQPVHQHQQQHPHPHPQSHQSHQHQSHQHQSYTQQQPQSQSQQQPVYATLNPVKTSYHNSQPRNPTYNQVQRQSPSPKSPVTTYRHVIHDQFQSQVGKPVRVQIHSQQQHHHHPQHKYQHIKPTNNDQWNEPDDQDIEYESDRENDQYEGDDMKIAKNVDNLGDAAFVKAKGTWYRARKCHKCGKTFPWASSLRRHLMTHTGLKPYCCAQCKAQFTTKSNLERHILRRHGVLDKEGQAKYVIKLSQKELERQLEQENEDLKQEYEMEPSVIEEIVEEDGIIYDYQNINGEVLKHDNRSLNDTRDHRSTAQFHSPKHKYEKN